MPILNCTYVIYTMLIVSYKFLRVLRRYSYYYIDYPINRNGYAKDVFFLFHYYYHKQSLTCIFDDIISYISLKEKTGTVIVLLNRNEHRVTQVLRHSRV